MILSDLISILNLNNIDYIIVNKNGKIIEQKVENNSGIEKIKENIDSIISKDFEKNIYFEKEFTVFNIEQSFVIVSNKQLIDNYANYVFVLQNIIELSKVSFLIVDKFKNILFANTVFLKQYGFNREDIDNYLITELIPPLYLEKIVNILKKTQVFNTKMEIYDALGNNVPIVLNAVKWADKHIIIIENIVEKESVNREIEGLKKMQKLIFDSIEQGIVVLDIKGNIMDFNRFMEKEYKFNKQKMLGMNIFEIVPDLKERGLAELFYEIVEKKKIRKISQIKRYSRRLKKELYQNIYGYPLIDRERVIGAVIFVEDLTHTKEMEIEYQLTKQQNEIVNKLNSILSKTIELDKVLMYISEYIFKILQMDKIIVLDNMHNSLMEYTVKNDKLKYKRLKFKNDFIDKINKLSKSRIKIITQTSIIYELVNLKSIKQLVIIPIVYNNKRLGYFLFLYKQKDELKMQLLDILQEYLGYILDKTFIYEEKKSNLNKIEFILKVSKIMSAAQKNENTYAQILELVMSEIKATQGMFLLKTIDERALMPIAYTGRYAEKMINDNKIDYQELLKQINKNKGINRIFNEFSISVFPKNRYNTIYGILKYKNETMGMLIFAKPKSKMFEQENIDLVNIIINGISNYVKNIHLQMQMEEKIDQLSILYKISSSIRVVINCTFLKKALLTSLGTLLKSDFAIFLKHEDNTYKIEHSYFRNIEYKELIIDKPFIDRKYLKNITNFKQFNKNALLNKKAFKKKINSSIVFSIKNKNEHLYLLLGFIDKQYMCINEETFFAIYNEMNIAFDNAILFEENERSLKQFNSINSIIKRLAQLNIDNMDEYYEYIVNAARELVNSEYASLLIKSGNELKFKAFSGINIEQLKSYSIKIGEGIAGQVAKTKEAIIVNDVIKNKYYKKFPFTKIYQVKNLINVPLVYKNEIIGVLCVDNKRGGPFNANDILLLKILANSTIIAFENFLNIEIGGRLSNIILNNIPSGVVYIDSKGYINYVNNGFIKISKYSKEDVLNIHYSKIFKNAKSIIEQVINNNKQILRKEVTLIKKSKQYIPCGISITPIKENKGTDIIAIIQDLSQIKRIRRELKEKENLALLGQTAAGMAHEIKNPLAGILTGLEFMHMKLSSEDDILKQSLELVIKEVKRLDRLVNDMTSFAKAKMKIVSDIDIKNLINRALNLTKTKFTEKKIDIELNIPERLKSIKADEEQLLEVIINIILNASQAIEKEGIIKISVEQDKMFSNIKIFNNGPPIPDSIYDKIFNPFFTTKSGGTGLGLAISYNIIKEHNGKLRVNNLQDGVEFIISLPYKQEEKNG